jgi:hypothetical protein
MNVYIYSGRYRKILLLKLIKLDIQVCIANCTLFSEVDIPVCRFLLTIVESHVCLLLYTGREQTSRTRNTYLVFALLETESFHISR